MKVLNIFLLGLFFLHFLRYSLICCLIEDLKLGLKKFIEMECFGEAYIHQPYHRFYLTMAGSSKRLGFDSRFVLIWFLLLHKKI